jgi:hypothetical protein
MNAQSVKRTTEKRGSSPRVSKGVLGIMIHALPDGRATAPHVRFAHHSLGYFQSSAAPTISASTRTLGETT